MILKDFGFKLLFYKVYYYSYNGLLIFVYKSNIILAYKKNQ